MLFTIPKCRFAPPEHKSPGESVDLPAPGWRPAFELGIGTVLMNRWRQFKLQQSHLNMSKYSGKVQWNRTKNMYVYTIKHRLLRPFHNTGHHLTRRIFFEQQPKGTSRAKGRAPRRSRSAKLAECLSLCPTCW